MFFPRFFLNLRGLRVKLLRIFVEYSRCYKSKWFLSKIENCKYLLSIHVLYFFIITFRDFRVKDIIKNDFQKSTNVNVRCIFIASKLYVLQIKKKFRRNFKINELFSIFIQIFMKKKSSQFIRQCKKFNGNN